MQSDTALYYDGLRASLAMSDGRGGVVEFVTDRGRPETPVVWSLGGGTATTVRPMVEAGLYWARSEDPYEVAEALARDCSAAMCRTEANYARAKARLASERPRD